MARERQTTIIDGHRYEMTMLGATAGYRLFLRLFQIFGPSFGKLMDSAKGKEESVEDIDLSSAGAVEAITALTERLTSVDLDFVVDQLRGQTHVGVEGSSKTVPLSGLFEVHFSGDIAGMFKWLVWGLKVQYSTFSTAFASLIPPAAAGDTRAESSRSL